MNQARTHSAEEDPGEPSRSQRYDRPAEPCEPLSLEDVHARRGTLVRLAYRFCWNLDDAEDAVQSGLLLASQRRHQLSQPRRLWSWVRAIVVRQCHEIRRRRARERREDGAGDASGVAVAGQHSPAEGAERAEFHELLRLMIGTLPERQQTALVLRHLEEISYGEIARIMETTESTARVQVRNGREALRRAILRANPNWAADQDT